MTDDRLDPDAILKVIDDNEKRSREAKLRIFLGMSAGVGKTYSMLRAARQLLQEGTDVVIGVAVTHGRPETAALLEGLPVIPLKKIKHRDTILEELDLDAILTRKPKLVIIDELAHSNVPGSRHAKRYQDILEILDAGIDVYTAVNVQHLESRKDSVESITGIQIRETVPDSILERATQLELVDIAPAELLKRLKEGKVYLGDKVKAATENFFKLDRLTALREMALRMTAERVDQDLQRMAIVRKESLPWQTNERLLVAISHSPYSEKLIRTTRRLAYNLEAPWIAVHVDTGITLNDTDQAQLVKNLELARELNAEVMTTTETDLPAAIRRICRTKNVTQVIVGRPTRIWFRDIIEGGSLLKQLIRENVEVDVHVIRQETLEHTRPSLKQEIQLYKTQTGPIQYWNTFCFLMGTSFICGLLNAFIGYRAVGFIFLLAVLVVGMFGALEAVFFAAILSAVTWNFFFIPPTLTFAISTADDAILCFSFFVVALITGFLTNRIRLHERLIRDREVRTHFLYEVLQDIASSQGNLDFLSKVTARVGELLKANCGVILVSPSGELDFEHGKMLNQPLDEKDQAVASWSFQNKKNAGWSTSTLAQSKALYIPLKGLSDMVGLFVFEPLNKNRKLDLEQEILLQSITKQLGVSIERYFLKRRLADTQRLKDSEELHQTLLNSISHEMRTPLTAIMAMASTLENEKTASEPLNVKSIAQNLLMAGSRLNRVIENLLDMSRLNSGILSLKLEWQDINDLIGVVVKKNEKSLENHKVTVKGLDEIILLKIDFRLMEHAISNLLLNASLYSPQGSEIQIILKVENMKCFVEVNDEGPGIPSEAIKKVFDKFYRVPGTPAGGTGLGLSIVKSIVELHKGQVSVRNRQPQGASFQIELPIEEGPKLPPEVIV